MNNLILIGFKGAGKTTLGRMLSTQLQRPFIDTDALMDEPDCYQKRGEKAFRAREKEIVQRLVCLKGHVIATGGGTVLDPQNQRILCRIGTVVHLYTPKEVIFQRIGNHPFWPQYEMRLGIYTAIAHHNISCEEEIWEVIRLDPFSASPRGGSHMDLQSVL